MTGRGEDLADRTTVEAAIREGGRAFQAISSTPMLDARLLVGRVLGLDAAGLILAGREVISHPEHKKIRALIDRRSEGEPVSHILGEREFRSLTFRLRSGVLAPRPESETLIDAVETARPRSAALRVLDLGVGSGCLLAALLASFPKAVGVGVDRNTEAAALARENARLNGVDERAHIMAGDWGRALTAKFDVIVTNPPYIPYTARESLPREVREHEDERALFAGEDGLDAYREILSDVARLLAVDGFLVMELGAGQAQAVTLLARRTLPLARVTIAPDLAGAPRALMIDRSQPANSL